MLGLGCIVKMWKRCVISVDYKWSLFITYSSHVWLPNWFGKDFYVSLHEVYGSRVYKWGAMMWDDIKGEVRDYEKEKVNFALYARGVDMLRKCRHVCPLIQSRMEWFGIQLVQ